MVTSPERQRHTRGGAVNAHEAPAGEEIPAAALAVLAPGPDRHGSFDQAIPLLTVDNDGFPHVALLSRAQLRDGGNARDLHAVVWAGTTSANLMATRRATVILVGGQVAWYLKLAVIRAVEHDGRVGVILRLAKSIADSAGVDLVPMGFRSSAALAAEEGWDADRQVLDLLGQPN
jgi:hypothetical protein